MVFRHLVMIYYSQTANQASDTSPDLTYIVDPVTQILTCALLYCTVYVGVCCNAQLFTASWKLNYSWRCQLVDYSDNPDELRVSQF